MSEGFKSEWEEKIIKFVEAHPEESWAMVSKLSPEAEETKKKINEAKKGSDPVAVAAEVARIKAAATPEVQAELTAYSAEFHARVNKHASVQEHIPARSASSIPFFRIFSNHVRNVAKRRGAEALLLHEIAKDLTTETPNVCKCWNDDQSS